jgi:Flp pilus assembly protein TadD
MALAATGKLDVANQELDSLRRIAAQKSMDGFRVTFSRNGAKAILEISTEVLAGEIAAKHGNYDQAVARLHRAGLLEDNLIYNEPPDWHVPVRQSLGAVLLEAGRAPEAEAVYWQDLSLNRENGWSLFGLMQSLRAQGKEEQAVMIKKRFKKAWNQADVTLTASRFMGAAKTTVAKTETAVSGN